MSLLAKPKAESFGHGKTWILAKGKNTCKDQILAKHPPGSSFLLTTEGDQVWLLLHKQTFVRLKSSDFKGVGWVGSVKQDKATVVAAKLCQRAVSLEALCLVFDESVSELPEVAVLLNLAEDDFNKQAAEMAVDPSKKEICKLLPKVRKLRAEQAKKAVELQKIGEDAAKLLEPLKKLSEKEFQQYLVAVKSKPTEMRTDAEKTFLRVQPPLAGREAQGLLLSGECCEIHQVQAPGLLAGQA